MIHTYSLVHDDLPAMDNDEYRRGRKTTHVVYGEDMGILAGDALLNYAFETAFQAFVTDPEESLMIGRALRVLGKKAGIYGMIGGQVIDVKETGHAVSKEILEYVYELKTAALIEAAMMIGAIIGGATEEEVRITSRLQIRRDRISDFRMIFWMSPVQKKCLASRFTAMKRMRRQRM